MLTSTLSGKLSKALSKENNNKYKANSYRIIKYKKDGIDNSLNFKINNNVCFYYYCMSDLETTYITFEKATKAFLI